MLDNDTSEFQRPVQSEVNLKEEIDDLGREGVTNNEWLRYRLTGELPERLNPVLEARWKTQVEGYEKWKELREVKKKPRYDLTEAQTQTLKDLTLAELEKLSGKPQQEYGYYELKQATDTLRNIYSFGSDLFFIRLEDQQDFSYNLDTAIDVVKSNLIPIGEDNARDPKTKAAAIESICFLEALEPSQINDTTGILLEKCIQAKDTQTLCVLLKSSRTVGNDVVRFIDRNWDTILFSIPPEEKARLLFPLLDGLCNFAFAKLENMKGYEPSRQINTLISRLGKEIRQDPNLSLDTEADKKFQDAATTYTHALTQNTNDISEWNPSHGTASSMLEALTHLCAPINTIPIAPPLDLLPFLQKLYYHKVIKFSTAHEPNFLHGWFRDIAHSTGIPMRKITG